MGIGDNYNKYLVEKIALAGRGEKLFIPNVYLLIYKIFGILNACSNLYLKNIDFDIENNLEYFKSMKYKIIPYSSSINQNDIVIYGFICPGNIINNNDAIHINLKYNDNENKIMEIKDLEKLKNGDELSKLIVGTLINNKTYNKNLPINKIIQLSKDYEVLCPYTCFFGSIDNHENIKENGLIQLNNFYLQDNTRPNVQIITPKTGKHGHAKKITRILNEKEIKLFELIEENPEREMNIDIEKSDFGIVKNVIKKQNIDGSWNNRIFDEEKYENIYKAINNNFDKDMNNNVTNTFFVIYILREYYNLYEKMLYQVINKGKHYLKENGIVYDDEIKKINFGFKLK